MPLIITAGVGFVLIVASFIPATIGWGEVAAVWFDILAGVAFILGGGNLLKVQLKKISDQSAGWGYALVTLIAFLTTLFVGLFKIGVPPAENQEFFGQNFVELPLDELPESQTFRVDGEIPWREVEPELPASVRRQLSEEDGQLVFRGWINGNQVTDLKEYNTTRAWYDTVDALQEKAQPPGPVKTAVSYLADHEALAFKGVMSNDQKNELLNMDGGEAWKSAIEELDQESHKTTEVEVTPPEGFEVPKSLTDSKAAEYNASEKTLTFTGPMSTSQRNLLMKQFPVALPMTDEQRTEFRKEIESRGEPFTEKQVEAFNKVMDGLWTVDQLIELLNLDDDEQEQQIRDNLEQVPAKNLAEKLTEDLKEDNPLTAEQAKALGNFLETQPTVGERNETIYFALLRGGPLSADQKQFLLSDIQAEVAWNAQIVRLFEQAHQVKYPWSGGFNDQGTAFWWIYEYLFKPLTATMFSLLAFYVASAAFRAFRAKNVEATLLLGTAFIILLGRTYVGVWLTDWVPDSLSGLRIENLAVYIMQVFNTAGNRAIMIGIALGIASTSLKVLLGIDRSYLGSQED
ncbi:MAG: hypothetical protein KDA84_24990 [Planctomycetaceae bacterium]|nr:hypothetical protein [Planctomycetaceae bacterium]